MVLAADLVQNIKLTNFSSEVFDDMFEAIKREKQLKNWHRDWKTNLIKSANPKFEDLYTRILK